MDSSYSAVQFCIGLEKLPEFAALRCEGVSYGEGLCCENLPIGKALRD
jgi:hypothetical protein